MCAAKVIEELIDLAELGEALGLTENQIAFYDVLETNDSAVKVIPCYSTGTGGHSLQDHS